MATKKTNNKKEETPKKTSAPKKSAEKEKTAKKQAATSKKKTVSPVKKIDRKSSVKKTAVNSLNKNSLSKKTYRANTIRKIEPIKTEDIDKKPERESIKLLREAIKAKSKTVSKPVAVKKHLIVKEDEDVDDTKENNESNIEENEIVSSQLESSVIKSGTDDLNKVDFSANRFEKKEEIGENNSNKETIEETTKEEKLEEKKSEVKTFTKNTYSKSDIFKRAVSIKSPIEAEELRKNIEQSKFNQSEIDEAIENAAMIEEDTPIEDYSIYSSKKLEELKRKDIKIIETEDEMKSGGIPEIERKPAEPYVAPPHSTIKKEKKSNKTVAIIGIIIIILGLAYLGFQFLGNKNDGTEDGFYDNNIAATNENETETDNIISPITNDTNSIEIGNIENTNEISTNPTNDINAVITEETNNNENIANTNAQTNNSTVATNNVTNTISRANTNITTPQPNLPNPPVIPNPPPNPQSQTSNQNRTSYLSGNTYRTKWTDTLTSIASSELGDARRWPSIYVMNENIFKDPDSLVFNKDIKIPENKKKIDDMTAEEKRALYDDYMRVVQVYLSIGKTNSANTLRSRARLIVR
ncbi:hypothetical protein [Brachyspira sp.]|uniref:LysM peptidoglycan-binding domain-containing protein n=1 Tax=Brachyspira sp. TaxID=1977261 RepID=UPI003D7D93A0